MFFQDLFSQVPVNVNNYSNIYKYTREMRLLPTYVGLEFMHFSEKGILKRFSAVLRSIFKFFCVLKILVLSSVNVELTFRVFFTYSCSGLHGGSRNCFPYFLCNYSIHRRIFYINTVPVMDIIVFMCSSSNIAQKSSQSAV